MSIRRGLPVVAMSAAVWAGCAGDKEKQLEPEKPAVASQALTELGEVRSGLDEALTTYKSGDAKAADTQVGDAYLQHFELVEGPLEKKDPELKETLEESIREKLRDRMQAKAPKAEVAKLVARIDADLDKAEAALR